MFTFSIGQYSVRRVCEPDGAVRFDNDIVRRIEALALVTIHEYGDFAIVLCSRYAMREVGRCDQTTFLIDTIPIREIRRFAKDGGFIALRVELEHSIVRDIRPHNHVAFWQVDGTL